ncbi:MAG: phosphopantetheine-binding protein [Synergistaceae bacterium]|jgi:acyl carrier protein|nr:phosphopantetheine-binding protein [Synergistaceae bacterium]
MTLEEKISLIEETIEADKLNADMELKDVDVWDSLGRLSIIIMFDQKFNKNLNAETLAAFKTVRDIADEME